MPTDDSYPTRRFLALAILCTSALSLVACTSTGRGSGTVESTNTPVTFSWTSKDGGITGTMSATLSGATLAGPFLQLTSTSQSDSFAPLWSGWSDGWRDWSEWGGWTDWGPDTITTSQYSGKVLANLKGTGSQRLRCKFRLNAPASGMSGGGQGRCQDGTGKTIDAVFPRA